MYFTLSQIQYLGLALLGGLILIAILAIAFWSYRLQVGKGGIEKMDEFEQETAEDESVPQDDFEHQEGHRSMPLIIALLIIGLIVWGIGYTLAHSFGVFYAQ